MFHVLTGEIDRKSEENLKFLCDLYAKSFGLVNLPSELTFRLAHLYLINKDETTALKLISDKINSNLNNEILQRLIKYLQSNSSLITIDGLRSIGNLFVNYRPNDSIRKFWTQFFDLLLEKSSSTELVQFYSEAVRKNSHIPYLHLFQVRSI